MKYEVARHDRYPRVRLPALEGTAGRVMHPRVERRDGLRIRGYRPTQEEASAQIPEDPTRRPWPPSSARVPTRVIIAYLDDDLA